jgi:hypothetical protein
MGMVRGLVQSAIPLQDGSGESAVRAADGQAFHARRLLLMPPLLLQSVPGRRPQLEHARQLHRQHGLPGRLFLTEEPTVRQATIR